MQKQMIEMIEKNTTVAMESARKFGELNQRSFDKLFQQQADLAAFFMDAGARGLELMTKAKGYQDLLAGQTALMRECGERGINAVRASIDLANEAASEFGNLAQEGYTFTKQQMDEVSNLKVAA